MARKKVRVRRRRKPNKFTLKMKRKLVVVFSVITLALFALIGRLIYINLISGSKYEKIVLSQQAYDSTTIPFKRGDITDRNGTVLATSVDVYNVILDCSVVNTNENYVEPTVTALSQCFGISTEELEKILTEKKDSKYYILAKKLTYDKIQSFVEIQNDTQNNPYVKGVWFEKEYQREYPYNSLAASLIGFTSAGNVGTNGLENYYDDVLNGTDGRTYGYLNSDSNLEKTTIAAEDGESIVSTIDANIQSIVEQKILAFNQEHAGVYDAEKDGSLATGVVVMNPNNGEVLAMANYPTFDLNAPRDYASYFTQGELEGKSEEEILDLLNGLWQNYTVSYTYEPGSTIKPFTVATGLETGAISKEDTYYCDGYELVDGFRIKCSNRSGHGVLTLEQSLMYSCNDALMQMGFKIGGENLLKYQRLFNFGLKTNVDLPGEARTDSLVYNTDTLNDSSLATNSFGQNFNVTMIQMASAFSSLVNGGDYYLPHLVKKIVDAQGNTVQNITPTLLKETVSEDTSDTLKKYMQATVDDGTAQSAKVEGYEMGGKTGTAQKLPREDKKYLVSFIGFAPVKDPQVVIYVVIDEPNDENQAQSGFATTLAQQILAEVLPYMNIYPGDDDEGVENPDADMQEEYGDGIIDQE